MPRCAFVSARWAPRKRARRTAPPHPHMRSGVSLAGSEAVTPNGSRSRRIAILFLLTAVALGAVQFVLLRHVIPPPDGLMYFQVADQIQRVGYLKALPIHWSPLYPIYVVLLRHLLPSDGAAELTATSAGDAALLVLLCATAVFAFRSLARVCWPDDDRPRAAWVSYAGGLALYCAFALLRVGLRMPDALVTSIVIGGLWA